MFTTARRLLSLATLSFAAMGFLAVPIFDKTGFEHTRDFFASDEAQLAGEKLGATLETFEGEWQEAQERRKSESDANEYADEGEPPAQVIRRRRPPAGD